MRRCALIAVLHVGMCVDLARPQLRICAGRRCRKNGSAELIAAARALAHPDAADVRAVGCDGTCPAGAVLCGDTPVHVPSTAQAFHAASAALSAAGAPYSSAGFPHPGLQARSLPPLLMHALSRNDFPDVDAGLHSVWQFATPMLRFVFQGDEEDFIRKAHETARELPTSFYGSAMAGGSWEMEGEMRRVGGEDGWIAVQVRGFRACVLCARVYKERSARWVRGGKPTLTQPVPPTANSKPNPPPYHQQPLTPPPPSALAGHAHHRLGREASPVAVAAPPPATAAKLGGLAGGVHRLE